MALNKSGYSVLDTACPLQMRYPIGAVEAEYHIIVPTGIDPVAENTDQYSIFEESVGSFGPAEVFGPDASLE